MLGIAKSSEVLSPQDEADHIEREISYHRLQGDWQRVMHLVEEYSHRLEKGDIVATSYHPSIEKIKAFYWECLAEATFELKNEINNAIDCCCRSQGIDSSTNNVRIIACRILLEVGGVFLYQNGYGSRPRCRSRLSLVFTEVDIEVSMADYIKTFSKAEKRTIVTALQHVSPVIYSTLVAIFGLLEASEVVSVLDEVMRESKTIYVRGPEVVTQASLSSVEVSSPASSSSSAATKSTTSTADESMLNYPAIVARIYLRSAHKLLHGVGAAISRGPKSTLHSSRSSSSTGKASYTGESPVRIVSDFDVNAYSQWLHIDACTARALISEYLGDIAASIDDLRHLLQQHLTIVTQIKLEGPHAVASNTRRAIAAAAVRLALMEVDAHQVESSGAKGATFDFHAVRSCVSLPGIPSGQAYDSTLHGLYQTIFPPRMQRALYLQAALATLHSARCDSAHAYLLDTVLPAALDQSGHSTTDDGLAECRRFAAKAAVIELEVLGKVQALGLTSIVPSSIPFLDSVNDSPSSSLHHTPSAVGAQVQPSKLLIDLSVIDISLAILDASKKEIVPFCCSEVIELSQGVEPAFFSLVSYLPTSTSDPRHIAEESVESRIAMLYCLLARRKRILTTGSSLDVVDGPEDNSKVIDFLEWGLSSDLNCDADSPFFLAQEYCTARRWYDAQRMLIRSHDLLRCKLSEQTKHATQIVLDSPVISGPDSATLSFFDVGCVHWRCHGPRILNAVNRESLLLWLGARVLPTLIPWFPMYQSVVISLNTEVWDHQYAMEIMQRMVKACINDETQRWLVMATGFDNLYQSWMSSMTHEIPHHLADCQVRSQYHTLIAVPLSIPPWCELSKVKEDFVGDIAGNMSSHHVKQELLQGRMKMLLQLLARSHLQIARIAGLPQNESNVHYILSSRLYGLILLEPLLDSFVVTHSTFVRFPLSTPATGSNEKVIWNICSQFTEHQALDYAITLGELGEISAAMTVCKVAITAMHYPTSYSLTHLLALLLCNSGSSPSAIAAAVTLCTSINQRLKNFNVYVSLCLLRWLSEDKDNLNSNLDTVAAAVHAASKELVRPQSELLTFQIRNYQRLMHPQFRCNIANIAVQCSQQYRLLGNFVEARRVLSAGWDALYAFVDRKIEEELSHFDTTSVSETVHTAEGLENISSGPSSSVQSSNWSSAVRRERKQAARAHNTGIQIDRASLLRQVPTVLGWRLPTATGWGFPHSEYCEAALLHQAAGIFQDESGDYGHPHALTVLQLALAICPDHYLTLIDLAAIELHLSTLFMKANIHLGTPNVSGPGEEVLSMRELVNQGNSAFSLPDILSIPGGTKSRLVLDEADNNIFADILGSDDSIPWYFDEDDLDAQKHDHQSFTNTLTRPSALARREDPSNVVSVDYEHLRRARSYVERALRIRELDPRSWYLYARVLYLEVAEDEISGSFSPESKKPVASIDETFLSTDSKPDRAGGQVPQYMLAQLTALECIKYHPKRPVADVWMDELCLV